MERNYKTVLKAATAEIEEKKSRFIANVKPVFSEEEAIEFINDLKARFWDATHNVYAYYIFGDSVVQRFSDDGEPSGTAGMPVLEVIKRMGLCNVVVVVTRYFGGTLLGASGLIRAYSRSAAEGILAAGIIERIYCTKFQVTVEYALLGRIRNLIESEGFYLKDVIYGQDIDFIVYVPKNDTERFSKLLIEAANADILIENLCDEYISVDKDGKYIGT